MRSFMRRIAIISLSWRILRVYFPSGACSVLSVCGFFAKTSAQRFITARTRQKPDQTLRSEKLPALANPMTAASANRIIPVMEPPFFSLFRVTIITIPPAIINNATKTPALPLISPDSASEFDSPAAHDWNKTMMEKTRHKIPVTSFATFIFITPSKILFCIPQFHGSSVTFPLNTFPDVQFSTS